ncbi:hypothetical protein VE04_09386 [Pseudogymnoascus sp. 24MN13]|nr:hypothetical protein VE04_09386 [Pseudogymnoascus sp. 24MN13]
MAQHTMKASDWEKYRNKVLDLKARHLNYEDIAQNLRETEGLNVNRRQVEIAITRWRKQTEAILKDMDQFVQDNV